MPIIEVKNVSKTFTRGATAVEAIGLLDFAVEEGEFLTLIGPSGCGKSTVLNMIGGLLTPTTGEVMVRSQLVNAPIPKEVAYMFQESTLYPWRDVLRNVTFGLEIARMAKQEREARARRCIDMVGLSGWEKNRISDLSGGMKQRVSLARALALETPILLLDEPFGALDEQTRIVLGDELLHVWQETGKTIILVTHSLAEASYLSDRVVVLTGRPSRMREVMRVGLPRPRTMESPELSEIRLRIWNLLSTEVRI
jgi:NitT/TauT family transport system ATP-binding protein